MTVMMASNVPAQLDQLVPSNCVILTPEGMPNPTLYALDMHAEIAGCERGGLPVNVGPMPRDEGREGAIHSSFPQDALEDGPGLSLLFYPFLKFLVICR